MLFNTELLAADWDGNHCRITTSTDEVILARYLVTALGLLSTPVYPDIPGIDTFDGQKCHTSAWDQDIQLGGKRVGVIGCGSTGVQVITDIADKVGQLWSFQRHPQYSVPSGIRTVTREHRNWVNQNYERIIAEQRESSTCFGIHESRTPMSSVAPEDRERVFQKAWDEENAFRFTFSTFSDITTDDGANQAACEFVRKKIAQTVKDADKARKLTPHDAYARRPICDHGYYERFNKDHVDVVDLREESIEAITPTGITTTSRHYNLDIIIFATGFDAIDGSYNRVRFRNGHGETLRDHWNLASAPTSYLGNTIAGFPNFFMITGPQSPFTNVPASIEQHVELNTKLIRRTEEARLANGHALLEPTAQAEEEWVSHCNDLANATLFPSTKSWIFGHSVEGKKIASRYYMGGMVNWLKFVDEMIRDGYRGYKAIR